MARLVVAVLFAVILAAPIEARAHCDTLDGPVVKAAEQALATGNVSFALMWVQEKDEPEIKAAFEKTLAVRRLGPDARSLADRYFFETVVRVHRASEGEPYTGLKPAGLDHGPAIPAAEKAIETGSADPLIELLTSAIETAVAEQLKAVLHTKHAATSDDVASGRRFVMAYVRFIHFVERIYEAATTPPAGHTPHVDEDGHDRRLEGGAL